METMEKVKLIEKEQIPSLTFDETSIVVQPNNLRAKLADATKLGNLFHGKVRIIFHADQGKMAVETTIWATGNQYIALKGGMWLPINRIENIEMI